MAIKVIHIESGLGNQMLSFCEYLAIKKVNPDDDIYIETIIYEIPEANERICQWNGFELERIFKIKAPNVKDLFTEGEWKQIIDEVRTSRFWDRNWNYPVVFTEILRKHGLELKNVRGDFEAPGWPLMVATNQWGGIKRWIKNRLEHFLPYIYLRRYVRKKRQTTNIDYSNDLFMKSEDNMFSGQRLTFKLKNSGIERIEKEIAETFQFPEIEDEKNRQTFEYIKSHESVAIHARRGDMLGYNYEFYVTGYFKRAVKFIRQNASHPIFFVFCDPDSVQWAKDNSEVLGLNFRNDEIHFVDWNKSENSFRDMQLMAACKYQVITNSTFGWWGAWMNTFPQKITCSPDRTINTTHSF